jgi:hypothetical protein
MENGMKLNVKSIVTLAAVIILITIASTLRAESVTTGSWEGAITFNSSSIAKIEVNLSENPTGIVAGSLTVPGQKSNPMEVRDLTMKGADISFTISDERTSAGFSGKISPDGKRISGSFEQAGQMFPFELNRKSGSLSAVRNTDANQVGSAQ